ncbi:TD and POZ domain-containing protein 1-like [Stegodyphus dumicola]|uniref:TD and POZ domain-containing protein 1-like n=1 Tax=Stegodyphus dumicola TaxID=202533 RepID=UPI0015B1CB79|nr:TD and POZ domain-containing protein 1-like [Stegodyphus dumicola]
MGSTQSEEEEDKQNSAFSTYINNWNIENFSNSVPTVGRRLVAYFNTPNNKEVCQWSLILYPKGFNDRVKNYISVWLKKTSPLEKLIEFSCSVVNAEGKEIKTRTIKKVLSLESELGWATFCKQAFILDKENKILKDGKLTLKCSLNIYNDKEILTAEVEEIDPFSINSSVEICEDLRSLLESRDCSDSFIRVKDETFPVHKAILSARSKVFRTMMQSKLQKSNIIIIKDLSKVAVQEMLRYIYYGITRNLNFDLACELFYASDKYEIFSLKKKCSYIIASNLSTSVAVDVLILSDRYQDHDLKDKAVRYISKHAIEITDTEKWFELLKNNQMLANKVVVTLARKTDEQEKEDPKI